MPVNAYEVMFILDASRTSTNLEDVRGQIHATLQKYNVELLASRPWSEKNDGKLDTKLAYPVRGQKKGTYYLTYFKCDSSKISDMEHDFRLSEDILRHMVIAVPQKWEETLEAIAKDENRNCHPSLREDPSLGEFDYNAPYGGGGMGRGGYGNKD